MSVMPVHQEGVTLEQLPVMMLADIFDHLRTPDLLKVCIASKYFYLPAAIRLYQRIVITDHLLYSYARKFLNLWQHNYGTAVLVDQLAHLVQVLGENEKLALLVHTVIVTQSGEIPNFQDLLNAASVKELYYINDDQIPQRLLNNVISLTTSIRPKLIAPMLSELHICNPGDDTDSDNYRRLALCMLENSTHQNLRILAFENTEDRNLRSLNMLNNDTERPQAGWIQFFGAFAQQQVKLRVRKLILEGYVRDTGIKIAGLLHETIDLDTLDSLALLCTELSHAHASHFDSSSTLLENLTKHTTSLTELSISPTDDCLTCQTHAITNALRDNLRGKLESLLVVFESPNSETSENVKLAILQYQPNLLKLRFCDKTTQSRLRTEIYHVLNSQEISEWEHGAFYNYRIRKGFFPNSFTYIEGPYFMSDPFARCIKSKREQIARLLLKDLVVKNALVMIPKLQVYELVDFVLNITEGAFLINDENVHFDLSDAYSGQDLIGS